MRRRIIFTYWYSAVLGQFGGAGYALANLAESGSFIWVLALFAAGASVWWLLSNPPEKVAPND